LENHFLQARAGPETLGVFRAGEKKASAVSHARRRAAVNARGMRQKFPNEAPGAPMGRAGHGQFAQSCEKTESRAEEVDAP